MTTETQIIRFGESRNVPNHPELPVLVYRQAIRADEGSLAEALESRYRDNGWGGIWRWGVYDFHHYHSNAHEVLGVASGEADLTLGGPDGKTLNVRAGDVVILPAGTGHKNKRSSDDFLVVGAYPEGQVNQDLIRSEQTLDDSIRQRIRETALPQRDPVFGAGGPLLDEWQ